MLVKSIRLLVSIIIMSVATQAYAASIYDDCIEASDFGQTKQTAISVPATGYQCDSLCNSSCKIFSSNTATDLNQDIVYQCLVKCKSGTTFSSRIKLPSTTSTTGYTWSTYSLTSSAICATDPKSPASPDYLAVDSGYVLKKGDPFIVNLFTPPGGIENKIIMCGRSFSSITPVYQSMKMSDWATNVALWNSFDNTASTYSVRNPYFTYTGVDVKDGDELSISFNGQTRSNCTSTGCTPWTNDNIIVLKNPSFPFDTVSIAGPALPTRSIKYIAYDGTGNALVNQDFGKIYKDNIALSSVAFGMSATGDRKKTRFGSGLIFPNLLTQVPNGSTLVDPMDYLMSFSGVLKSFSSSYTPLGFKLYGLDNASSAASNSSLTQYNLGGLNVNITRNGCTYNDGSRLQYGIGEPDPKTDEKNPVYLLPTQWIDITTAQLSITKLDNTSMIAPVSGKLFLRIKPEDFENSFLPVCAPSDLICKQTAQNVPNLYNSANRSGQYYVKVATQNNTTGVQKNLSSVVALIRSYLFGDPANASSTGLVQTIFNNLVSDSGMIQSIRALLVLYVAWTGLSFMLGLAHFTQKEGVTRLVKIGIVVTLISPNSWEYFNTTVFKFFTDGALELLIYITSSPQKTNAQIQALLENPVLIFDTFEEPFGILFSRVTWIKASALLISNPFGIIMFVVIVIAAFLYAITMVKAIMAYLVSIMAIAILLMMAPIFISFVLFQYTKKMFDTWWKLLLAMTFQPILIFTTLTMMSYLLLAALQMSLGFSVCRVCFFQITIPAIVDTGCLISWYVTLLNVHTPSGPTYEPALVFLQAFYLLLLAQTAYVLTESAGRLATLMIMQTYQGIDTMEQAGKIKDEIIDNTTSAISKPLGIDRANLQNAIGSEQDAARDREKKKKKSDKSKKRDGAEGGKDD